MGMNARVSSLAITALAAWVLLSGCTDGSGATDKSGATGGTVLRMANVYSSLDHEPGVEAFVDAVAEVSDGAMSVDVISEWSEFAADAEEQIVADVAAGEADLGWAGSRVFDLLGVEEFAPLTAPMLIDSYALQDAVIESGLPDAMLPSLDEVGLSGIAVLGGGLRKPIAATAPLVAAEDWNGVTFQAFPSNGHAAAVRALAANPTDVLWEDLDAGVSEGSIRGFEKNLHIVRINSQHLIAPYVTANVNLWPETSVVFANPGRLAQLTDTERRWLTEAAESAAASSSELYDDQGDLEFLCADGARATEASTAQLEELRARFAPVVDALRAGTARGTVERIEELKARTTAEPSLVIPADCAGAAAASAVGNGVVDEALDGVYRWKLTAEDGTANGAPADIQATFPWVMTMTLERGSWRMGGDKTPETSSGTYTTDDGRITFVWPDVNATLIWDYVVDSSGTLTLTPVDVQDEGDRFVWGLKPWQKID